MGFKLWKEGPFCRNSWKSTKGVPAIKPKYGIKVLHEPPKAIADLVFVHGITGHRDHTWSADQNIESWPKLMLPSRIPGARILTFGYDASVISLRRGISGNSIGNHSNNLLSALSSSRIDAGLRPIIFVAHSLGGLVVKDALLSSGTSPEPHLRLILDCVQAILFLGTPHYGVDLADIGKSLVELARRSGAKTNQKIVGVLQRDSEVLSRIQKGFQELLRSQHMGGKRTLEITCCYEELPIFGSSEVVPRESAILHGYPAIGIHADHKGMARFASADDPGFVSVLGELRRWIDQVAYADDGHHEKAWNVGRKRSSDALRWCPDEKRGGDEECRGTGTITIWGSVTKSVIANGNQTIQGNLIFGGS
ncbi:Alpha/Beta hydrolase protein [Xylaria cf. heliscus]|nr:Alpha/Beta hydrolase protein [Xylaria cf. heliscus]